MVFGNFRHGCVFLDVLARNIYCCWYILKSCLSRLMGAPHQWYTQRMRSESHTSSDYQDASEYLDIDANAGYYPGANQNSSAGDSNPGGQDDDEEDDDKPGNKPEMDDQNVGGGTASNLSCNDNAETDGNRSCSESEKTESASSEAGPSLSGDSVDADDAGSTSCNSNESL